MNGKPWFGGERTLAQQMVGPDALLPHVKGKTVLDLACAEGAIALEMRKAGAYRVHCIELDPERLAAAAVRFRTDNDAYFTRMDLNSFASAPSAGLRFDIVLALSIAHKLKRPDEFLRAAADRAREFIAIRLPHPIIDDRRSDHRKVDAPALMAECGFDLWHEQRGTFNEWNGIFRRIDAAG